MAGARVALLPPGEMGAAVGARLIAGGAEVATCLAGRGPRSAALATQGLAIRVVGGEIGQASAATCCEAALTKGFTALGTALLVAAERAGVAAPLAAEFAASQPEASAWLLRQLPAMPPKAWRWVAEMEEIGAFLDSVGVPGATLRGAAELYRKLADTPLGRETPETRDRSRDGRAVAEGLARTLG